MYEGALVRLRAFDNADLTRALDFDNDYSSMRGVTSGLILPSTVEDEARYISSQSRSSRGEYQFAVETLEDRVFIGRCGFIDVDWKNRRAELGIFIGDQKYRGRGFGSDAVRVLSHFGFSEMNLHKITAQVFDFNEAAIRCYEKCGFTREGLLRRELFREGEYHDVVVLGFLNE